MRLKYSTYAALVLFSVTMALLLCGCGGGGGASTPPGYTITGKIVKIVNNAEVGIEGVEVNLTSVGTTKVAAKVTASVSAVTATTKAGGVYSFTDVPAGDYTIGSVDLTYGFSPTPVSVSSAVSVANVTSIPAYLVYSIEGNIRSNNSLLPGVTVTVTGTSPAVTKYAITNAVGAYVITGLQSQSYTVTPTRAGYDFTDASITTVVTDTNKTGQDFTASLRTYVITGTIIDNAVVGVAIAGVKVSVSSTLSTVTDSTGSYSFNVVPGTYTISSTDQKYTFNPLNVPVVVTDAGKTVANIVAVPAFTITGTITRMDVVPSVAFTGVAVTLYKMTYNVYTINGLYGANNITRDSVATATATTNANGTYTLTAVPAGKYSIIPTLSGFVFNPDKIETISIALDGSLYKYDETVTGNHVTASSPLINTPIVGVPDSYTVTAEGLIIYNSGPFTITNNNVVEQNFSGSLPGGSTNH